MRQLRDFLGTPFVLMAQVFAWLAGVVTGRPIDLVVPLTLAEALENGDISEEEAEEIMRELERMQEEDEDLY